MEKTVGAAEAAQQYFHTYRIPANTKVVLKEYDLSAQSLSGDQRSIALATGLTVVSVGLLGTIIGSENGTRTISQLVQTADVFAELATYSVVLSVALIALRYFAELQRSATEAGRKIVVLRRLLGVDYGTIEKVMPTTSLEGANEPFALPMFPGWGAISSLAALIVAPFSAFVVLILFGLFSTKEGALSASVASQFVNEDVAVAVVWLTVALALLAAFRLWLLERWEDSRFLIGKYLSRILDCPLKDRIGHVIYRMELSVVEARRVGIVLDKMHPFVVAIEDKRFPTHRGNDWRAVARALWQRMRLGFISGGSTIEQQLFRSTCLKKIEKRLSRKVLEWTMAPWLDRRYAKKQVLDMYLCAVRFETGVVGLPAALNHFFGIALNSRSSWSPTPAQAVFLVERLSNVTQTVRVHRIRALVKSLQSSELITKTDVLELERIYVRLINRGILKGDASQVKLGKVKA